MIRILFALLAAGTLVVFSPTPPALAADVNCFIDVVNGDDSKSGLSEAEAVKSQSKIGNIGSTCTVVRFKRGSVFGEKLKIVSNVKTYTNYGALTDPLPKFVVPRSKSSGPVIQAMGKANLTFDGLTISGATGDGTMAGLMGGSCVVLGNSSQLTNSEITDCDIGVMLTDGSSVVKSNYIHDLKMGVDTLASVDPYLVGGGVGILINNSGSNDISYNTIVNCKGPAKSTGGVSDCYGGAIELIVASGGEIGGFYIKNNYSYNNCGFTAIGTYSGDVDKGKGKCSAWYSYNISVDSGWMAALEVNNTNYDVRFTNNTFVQHKDSTNAGILAVIYTGTSGGDLQPNSVSLTRDLFVIDGGPDFNTLVHKNFVQQDNLFIDMSNRDPGFVNMKGTTAADYDLTAGSPALNTGYQTDSSGSDFFNRPSPDLKSWTYDIGACEPGSAQSSPPPFFSGAAGWIGSPSGTGGKGGAGGATGAAKGGAGGTSSTVSGMGGAGGSTKTATGGATGIANGGAGGGAIDAGGTTPIVSGGASGTGGSKADASVPIDAGASGVLSSGGTLGGPGGSTGTSNPIKSSKNGCSCRLGQAERSADFWAGLIAIALLVLRRRDARS
jgi:MYXO-CTERM domain-containing protein